MPKRLRVTKVRPTLRFPTVRSVGRVGVDAGYIIMGDGMNKALMINTIHGDGEYPVYTNAEGGLVWIDLDPYGILSEEKGLKWSLNHDNFQQVHMKGLVI